MVRKRKTGRNILLYLSVFIFVFASVFVGTWMTRSFKENEVRNRWGTVHGKIISSQVKTSLSRPSKKTKRGSLYFPAITYAYSINGRDFLGESYSFLQWSTSNRAEVEAIVARFTPGSAGSVFYNPQNPSESVLNPIVPEKQVYLGIAGLVGYIIIPFLLIKWRKLRKKTNLLKNQAKSDHS